METISVIIPALNEREGIVKTIQSIPVAELKELGYQVQVLVVDNGSDDGTGEIARNAGADVILEPVRGYGNAYKAGFAAAKGDIIATLDADMTYPSEDLPGIIKVLEDQNLDFITTNRFASMEKGSMSFRNHLGNIILSLSMRLLFGINMKDSQSGMWIMRQSVLGKFVLKSGGMPFSEEMKIEAGYYTRCRWKEIPIHYRRRLGEVKLCGWRDGILNLRFLLSKRLHR